ncbi:MAG: RluA family pseudouridine synthase [Oscillospiraceae bacterium]|nr:RluA family pseudouridine synthase [Oscillospiraceae bacterium]
MILTYTASENDEGRKVYGVLRRELTISSTLVRRLKNSDGIKVNGLSAFTTRLLRPGDMLTVDIDSAEPPGDIVPEPGELDIIYEDEGLLAVNKPEGIIIHPTHSRYTGTLANYVAAYLNGPCHAVNRLDRDTSGVVLFSKNGYMKDRTIKALSAESSEKEYLALVLGRPDSDFGRIDMPIKRAREGDILRVVSPDGQNAVTNYELIASGEIEGYTVSALRLVLETGRTHQIRVHCLYSGFPLLGDSLYFTEASKAASGALDIRTQALHARRLVFNEPISGALLELTAELHREKMKKIFENLGKCS